MTENITEKRIADLEKQLEEKRRELEIEASLEKVRARTMAMQKSDELSETAYVLFQQFKQLGEIPTQITIGIFNEQDHAIEFRITGANGTGDRIDKAFNLSIEEPTLLRKMHVAWKEQKKSIVIDLTGQELLNWIKYRSEMSGITDSDSKIDASEHRFICAGFFSKGLLTFSSKGLISEETILILQRFAAVFDQAYTRFLDLEKAEAQAREAQIEAALERVRAKTMGMHKSTDLLDVISKLSEQFQLLGFKIHSANFNTSYREKDWNLWLYNPGIPIYPEQIHIPYFDHPFFNRTIESIAKGCDFTSFVFTKKEKDDFLDHLYANTIAKNAPEERKKYSYGGAGFAWSTAYFKNTALTIANYDAEPYTEEQNSIIRRFGNVFDQSYTRFLDLQKAEEQAREARIEVSLEKIRAQSMAMNKSEDLALVVSSVFNELEKLDVKALRCGIGIINGTTKSVKTWITTSTNIGNTVELSGDESLSGHTLLDTIFINWKAQKSFSYILEGNDLIDYYKAVGSTGFQEEFAKEVLSNSNAKHFYHCVMFPSGGLFTFSETPFSAETYRVLKRFADAFYHAYKRFEDLQRAEEQARESQIEAALEKVRGKAMAMHNSNDLSLTASMVFTELRKLGINPIRCGVGLLNKESHKAQLYSATLSGEDDNLALIGWVMLSGHPVLEKIYETWLRNEDYFPELTGEQLKAYYENLLAGLPLPAVPDWQTGEKQYGHFFSFSIGCLYAWSDTPYNDEEIKILKRFATIIDLTFRRYLELQRSEANAREAVKQAALDSVRAEIASMRTISDLDRITPLIWNELTILGIPFIRCGVFIMDESQKLIHTFLSTPDGKAIAAFHLPYETPGNFSDIIHHWRQKDNYISHWNKQEFQSLADSLVQQGAVATKEQYLETLPEEGIFLHFLPFLQGMLYVGNTTQLREEEIKLTQAIADAFSTAYARYEDFNRLEVAKKQVEKTLSELKQAQRQLIQSEKMASLGELTAGIAHEIQNPLNFVNNFSEVSNELIDEMKEELQKGDMEEVKAIANDIKQNLEKINHHGKRADAIVKGMLQHSRSSTGVKEPTDLNALADEYLRLSYHGLRAKDKSLNAEIKTNFDESIGKINIVPQDIGRVFLNLYNNAFYACAERSQSAVNQEKSKNFILYEPTVSVSTKRSENRVLITVSDNGNGIPQNVVDKIFQPFFTTKPTGEGTGLGLSLSYDIIKAHGGEIKVETEEEEGTEFLIQLPI